MGHWPAGNIPMEIGTELRQYSLQEHGYQTGLFYINPALRHLNTNPIATALLSSGEKEN